MKTNMIKSGLLCVAFGALAACASAPPPPPPKPVAVAPKAEVRKADPLEQAADVFAKGDYEGALKEYTAILQGQPDNETALFNKAVTLHKLRRLDEAKAAYEAFRATHPEHIEATLNLGAVLRDQGGVDAAIDLYNKALKKDPYSSKLLNNLVVLYREKKDYKKATEAVRTLLMRDQKNIDAYKNLALVHYDQQKYKLTQTILANALRMAKEQKVEDPDIHVNIGLTHLALGDKGKAMGSFKKAVEIDPNHLIGNYNMGSLALAHRDYALAEKTFAVCAKAWPSDPEVIANYGFALQGQQKFAEAATMLEKAKTLREASEPQTEKIVYQLMVVWQAAEQPEKALAYGTELLKIKNKECKADDYTDPVCSRINGINLMIQMKNKPPEVEEKPKVEGKGESLFTDAPAEGDEAAAPPPGEEEGAPQEAGATPPPPPPGGQPEAAAPAPEADKAKEPKK